VPVDASASLPDIAMMVANADADAELLLGQSDCKGDSVLPVSTSAQSAADSDDDVDDMSVMTDVDAGCCSAEADASTSSRQQRQCVDSAEAELSCANV
jgi:hypothetical protein